MNGFAVCFLYPSGVCAFFVLVRNFQLLTWKLAANKTVLPTLVNGVYSLCYEWVC